MKRGLISFAIVFLLVLPLLQIARLQENASQANSFYKNEVLLLEKRRAVELDVKNCFRQVFWSASGSDRSEVVEGVARKLVGLESFVEKHFAEEGIEVDLWFGGVGDQEVAALAKKILADGKPVKCAGCMDFSETTLDWRKKIVPKAMAFLDADPASKKIIVSRNGFAFVPEMAATGGVRFAGRVGFGASIYFPEEKAAAVIFLPEGFSAEYGDEAIAGAAD